MFIVENSVKHRVFLVIGGNRLCEVVEVTEQLSFHVSGFSESCKEVVGLDGRFDEDLFFDAFRVRVDSVRILRIV